MTKTIFTYTKAINIALHEVMSENHKSACIGLGINDPKEFLIQLKAF